MIIAFAIDRWFDFGDAAADFADVGGAIVLTKGAEDPAKQVREAVKENIKKSAKFGKDADKDGRLESEESSEDD